MKNGITIIGYDLNYEYCQISIGNSLDAEPETLYQIDSKDGTELPLILARRDEKSPWMTGVSAVRLDAMSEGIVVKDLLRLAMENSKLHVGSEDVSAVQLLTEFIRLSLSKLLLADVENQMTGIVFTVPRIDEDVITMLKGAAGRLGISKDRVYVQDYRESFYDYVMYLDRSLWNYDVMLFGYSGSDIYSYKFSKGPIGKGKRKELASVQKGPVTEMEAVRENDAAFRAYASQVIGKSLVSSSFLVGREFEEMWFESTRNLLASNRRLFLDRSLFSKGACYGGYRKAGLKNHDVIYLDNYKIISQVSLRLRVSGKEQWIPIAYQGENWYEVSRSIEVLADQTTSLSVQVDTIGNTIPVVETISLEGLFEKQRRTVRLAIDIMFMSKTQCRLSIRDVDFGEIRKASGYELIHTLQLDSANF